MDDRKRGRFPAAVEDINEALDKITSKRIEGGFQKDKEDTGNYLDGKLIGTNHGITPAAYEAYYGETPTEKDMKNLTKEDAKAIYLENYVNKPRFDAIKDPNIQAAIADFGIHSGPRRATKSLQKALGVTADGGLGPKTEKALKDYEGTPHRLHSDIFKDREDYIKALKNKKYEKGWLKRLENMFDITLPPATEEAEAKGRYLFGGAPKKKELEIPDMLDPKSTRKPLFKDGGLVKKYKNGGLLEPEATEAPLQRNPIHDLMRQYKALGKELPEQVRAKRYITPQEEKELKDFAMPDVSRKATFDLPQSLPQEESPFDELIQPNPEAFKKPKSDEEILDEIVKELDMKSKYADGGITGMEDLMRNLTGNPEYKESEDPMLDMIEKANREQELVDEIAANEPAPFEKSGDIVSEYKPKQPERVPSSSSEQKPEKKSEIDLKSKYESLLAELEKPKARGKSDEMKKAEWLDAISSIAGSLDRYGVNPRTPGRQTQFARGVAAREAKTTGMDSLKQRADILNQLQKLKDGSKPMTAYQKQYLEYLKGAQSKRQEKEDRIKGQSKEKMSRQLNKDIYGVVKDFEKDDVVKELKKQGVSFDQAESLLDAIEADNKVAFGALGTKMARAMGEVGVLTDADVVRYISRYDVAGKVKDWFSGRFKGKPSDLTQKDLRDIANIMKIGAKKRLVDVRDKYITYAHENFGKSADMSMEDMRIRFGLKDGKLPKEAMPKESNEVRRRTRDGKVAIFDADTKKFLRYEE